MALADFAAYKAAVAAPTWTVMMEKPNVGATAPYEAPLFSAWRVSSQTPQQGALPTSSVALDNTTTGALTIPGSAGRLVVTSAMVSGRGTSTISPDLFVGGLLIDRLVHSGGLDGTSVSAQTTNLPTATLTRYTDGVGVMIGIQIWSSLGSNDVTVSVSYTNSSNTAGRTGTLAFIGTPSTYTFYFVNLQAGDVGVKSVESVTLSGSTGSAGNFGVVLFKPLCFVGFHNDWADASMVGGWNSQIQNGACLEVLGHTDYATSATFAVMLGLSEV